MSTTKTGILLSLSLTFNHVYRFVNYNLTINSSTFCSFKLIFDKKHSFYASQLFILRAYWVDSTLIGVDSQSEKTGVKRNNMQFNGLIFYSFGWQQVG